MSTSIQARVRRVLRGHSERALVHAVDEAGLEYKIEVPHEAVKDVVDGQEHVLLLAWSIQPSPRSTATSTASSAPAASTTSSPTTTAGSPSAVDQAFMALMAQGRPRPGAAAPAGGATDTTGLEAMFGVALPRK